MYKHSNCSKDKWMSLQNHWMQSYSSSKQSNPCYNNSTEAHHRGSQVIKANLLHFFIAASKQIFFFPHFESKITCYSWHKGNTQQTKQKLLNIYYCFNTTACNFEMLPISQGRASLFRISLCYEIIPSFPASCHERPVFMFRTETHYYIRSKLLF